MYFMDELDEEDYEIAIKVRTMRIPYPKPHQPLPSIDSYRLAKAAVGGMKFLIKSLTRILHDGDKHLKSHTLT